MSKQGPDASSFAASFNWYPGHIAKAERELKEKIKLIDVIIELRDARAPYATAHRELKSWAGIKPIILVINKSDLVASEALKAFEAKQSSAQPPVIASEAKQPSSYEQVFFTNSKTTKVQDIVKALIKLSKPIREKFEAKGVRSRPIRVMVVGYPNTGKSTLINKLSQSKKAKVENKPGVTRSQQWIDLKAEKNLDIKLLDTPGIIPPKFYSDDQALKLAWISSLGDKAYDPALVAKAGIDLLEQLYPGLVERLYQSTSLDEMAAARKLSLDAMGRKLIQDYRDGRMGLISLEI